MGQSTTVIPTGGGGAKVQDSIPTNPQKGDLWVDTSETPPVTKWYDGTEFLDVAARIGRVADESELPVNNPAQIFFDNSTSTYKRSLPNDIRSASYTGTSISTQDAFPMSIAWKPDGSKLFEIGNTNDNIYEYDVPTAWDISTASYTGTSINTQDGVPNGIAWKSDGSKLFEIGSVQSKIYEYDVPTAWDISTASYTGTSINTQGSSANDIAWKPDGSKLFVLGDNIYEYDVPTAWNISTASYTGTSISKQGFSRGITWKPDGSKLFEIDEGKIYEYDVPTAWDISTASYLSRINISEPTRPS